MTIHYTSLFSKDDLLDAITEGLVRERLHDTHPLAIWNYTDKAMWTPGAWDNPAVRQCRGLVVDEFGWVVARPWAKFFNHNQPEAGLPSLDAPVEVTDKVDGSLGVIYPTSDGLAIATRGSFGSDQAIHATERLRGRPWVIQRPEWVCQWTPLVEIVYPENRIVCDYGDVDELVLLGAVSLDTGKAIGPAEAADVFGWCGAITKTFAYDTLRSALAASPRPGAEGLVVRYVNDSQRLVKIKQADYIALHRIVTGLSERTVWQAIIDGKEVEDMLDGLPDELHEWVRQTWDDLSGQADAIELDTQRQYDEIIAQLDPKWTRAEFAALAKGYANRAYLFAALDGKDARPAILKSLKPDGNRRPANRTEDNA